MEKQVLRKLFNQVRYDIKEKTKLSELICMKAIEHIEKEKFVDISCYFPLEDEVDTRMLIQYCLDTLKNIYLPHLTSSTEMRMFRLKSLSELKTVKFGLSQIEQEILAEDERAQSFHKFDVIFTPLLAFDEERNRLGYGKGYYDSFFSSCPKSTQKVGLAFAEQQANQIPTESHDVSLDLIITEKKNF